jgi:hypothetical protein
VVRRAAAEQVGAEKAARIMIVTTDSLAVQSTDKSAPDIMSGSARDREQRGQTLAAKFVNGLGKIVVKFIGELETEIVEVRQDFKVKPKDELICGVATFTQYCEGVLGYSLRHIERILEGHNPSLSDAENANARHRKAKRELDARVKRNQNALPLRPKTNAEILADKVEEKNVDALQKQVAVLTHKLQATSTKPSPVTVSEPSVKDLKNIHASEVKSLEIEIQKLKGSIQKITVAYTSLRSDAVRLANAGTRVPNAKSLIARAQTFLKKHGETVVD